MLGSEKWRIRVWGYGGLGFYDARLSSTKWRTVQGQRLGLMRLRFLLGTQIVQTGGCGVQMAARAHVEAYSI